MGEGLGDLVTCGAIKCTDGRHKGGSAQQRMSTCNVCPKAGCQSVRKADDQYCLLLTTLRMDCTTPCVSTLSLPDVIAQDQISQTFPCLICILQTIKCWWWEWPKNQVIVRRKERRVNCSRSNEGIVDIENNEVVTLVDTEHPLCTFLSSGELNRIQKFKHGFFCFLFSLHDNPHIIATC